MGWLGAVAAFLALAVAGAASEDPQMVRGSYLAMELTTWFVIVPFSLAALATGLVQSLGTPWGLFQHYWVLAKLIISLLATILLLLHTQPIGIMADVARERILPDGDLGRLQLQLVGDAGFALVALLVNVTLSVYKPRGVTPYGRRKQAGHAMAAASVASTAGTPRWAYVCGTLAFALVLLFIVLHLAGGGLHRH